MLLHKILTSLRQLARTAVYDERDPSKEDAWDAFDNAIKRFVSPDLDTETKQLVKDLRAYGACFPDGPGMFKTAADLIVELSRNRNLTQIEANNLIADFRDAVTDDALGTASNSLNQLNKTWVALELAIKSAPIQLYSYQPDGHGPYSFFVAASSPEEAAIFVNAYREHQMSIPPHRGDTYSYGATDLRPADFHVSAPGEVIENEND